VSNAMVARASHCQCKYILRVFFALFLVIVLAHQLTPTPAHPAQPEVPASPTPYSADNPPLQIHIQGRWKPFRASLGLPPRASTIVSPGAIARASRFNLKHRRAVEELASRRLAVRAPLFFAPGALEERSLTLEALAESFRAVSLFEKEGAEERVRERSQRESREGHRSMSSTTKNDSGNR